MKKAIIPIILIILGMTLVTANVIDSRTGGDGSVSAGAVGNTYEVDNYLLHLTGNEHILKTTPFVVQDIMYLRMWFDDIKKDQTFEIYNYNTTSWDNLGTILAGLKIAQQYEINMTNHYDTTDDTTQIRITSSNGDIYIDKIILTSSDVISTIKRVEQVDWVNNVGNVNTVNDLLEPTMTVHGTEYTIGQTAKLWVQLLNETGGDVEDGACQVDIYTPDNEELVEKGAMTNLNHDGIYYYDIATTNLADGVYPVIARCYYSVVETESVADDFNYTSGDVGAGGTYSFYSTTNGGSSYTDRTSFVTSNDASFIELRHDWGNKYALLNTTETIVNGDTIKIYVDHINQNGNTFYLTDSSGSTTYASYTIDNVGTFKWYNLTIQNAGSGISEIYFSDLGQGGAYDVEWEYIELINSLVTGTVNDTHTKGDSNYQIIAQNSTGAFNFIYTFENTCGQDTNEQLLTGANFVVNSQHIQAVTNDDISIYWYNYSLGDWVIFPNEIAVGTDFTSVSNFITTTNLTTSGVIDANGDSKIRLTDQLQSTGSGDKTRIDYVAMLCDEFTNPVWTEVKGSSEMHITGRVGPDNVPIYWVSSIDSGTITNETLEGFFYYNFTISSLSAITKTDQTVYIDMPAPFACYHINSVKIEGVTEIWYGQNPASSFSGCRVTWQQDIDEGANYEGQIVADKWFTHVENTWLTEAQLDYQSISLACNNYRIINGLPAYEIPINHDPKRGNDTFYEICNQYFDTYDHFNSSYYNDFELVNVELTPEKMLGFDNLWYHIKDTAILLRQMSDNILLTLASGGTYSTAIMSNPTGQDIPNFANYFATISASFDNYNRIGLVPANVWNYSNRTLTEAIEVSNVSIANIGTEVWDYDNRTLSTFDFDVVDEVEVSENVWNFTGTISTNILDQFASAIWTATTRTLTAFGFDVVDEENIAENVWNVSVERNLTYFPPSTSPQEIWEYVNRNLTYFPPEQIVDYEQQARWIWNSTDNGRYTHGVILN